MKNLVLVFLMLLVSVFSFAQNAASDKISTSEQVEKAATESVDSTTADVDEVVQETAEAEKGNIWDWIKKNFGALFLILAGMGITKALDILFTILKFITKLTKGQKDDEFVEDLEVKINTAIEKLRDLLNEIKK